MGGYRSGGVWDPDYFGGGIGTTKPGWGMPTQFSPTASPAAKEGAREGTLANSLGLDNKMNAKPKLPANWTPKQPVGQQFQMLPNTKNFGTPMEHYVGFQSGSSPIGGTGLSGANYQSTVKSPYAVGKGLVYDPTVVGGLRNEATTLDQLLERAGVTDANISMLGRTTVPGGGSGGSGISPRLDQSSADQAALFQDPTFRAAWNAAREASDARFQTARSQLANVAQQTGGYGSGEFLNAMQRLNAAEAKQRAQDILNAAAKVPSGPAGSTALSSLTDQVNSMADVYRITQEQGTLMGQMAGRILDAKKKAAEYGSDMETVQKSTGTFGKVQAQELTNIAGFQEQERQRRLSRDVLSKFGIKPNADISSMGEALQYTEMTMQADNLRRESIAAQDMLKQYGINAPQVTRVSEAIKLIDRSLRASGQRAQGKAMSPEEDLRRSQSFLKNLFGEEAPKDIVNIKDAIEYARANASQAKIGQAEAAQLTRDVESQWRMRTGDTKMDMARESLSIKKRLADVTEARMDLAEQAQAFKEDYGIEQVRIGNRRVDIADAMKEVAKGKLSESILHNSIMEEISGERLDLGWAGLEEKQYQYDTTLEHKKQLRADAKERFRERMDLAQDQFSLRVESEDFKRADRDRIYKLAEAKAVDSSERAWDALEALKQYRKDLLAGNDRASILSGLSAEQKVNDAKRRINNNAMKIANYEYNLRAENPSTGKSFRKENPSFADWAKDKMDDFIRVVDPDGDLQTLDEQLKIIKPLMKDLQKKNPGIEI